MSAGDDTTGLVWDMTAVKAPAPGPAPDAAELPKLWEKLEGVDGEVAIDAVCRLVECNVGVGVVPETTAKRAAVGMAIKSVELTDPWAVRDLTASRRPKLQP